MEIEAPQDNETVYRSTEVKLKVNGGDYIPLEELIISKEAISWKINSSRFFIPWDKIVVQAIQGEPQRSIYFMIDESWEENQDPVFPLPQCQSNGNGTHSEDAEIEDDDNEDEGEENNITEFWMVPLDADEVDNIYYIMTQCGNSVAPADDSSDDGEQEFLQGEDMEQMNINDDDDDDERFADAEQ